MGAQQRFFTLWSRWAYKVRAAQKKRGIRGDLQVNKGALGAVKLESTLQRVARRPAPVRSGAPPRGQQGEEIALG